MTPRWTVLRSLRPARFAERLQALARGFQLREAAAFLFDQIVFEAAAVFRSLKKIFPGSGAFAK